MMHKDGDLVFWLQESTGRWWLGIGRGGLGRWDSICNHYDTRRTLDEYYHNRGGRGVSRGSIVDNEAVAIIPRPVIGA